MEIPRKAPPGMIPFWQDQHWMSTAELRHVKQREYVGEELATDPVYPGGFHVAYMNVFYEYVILFQITPDPRTLMNTVQVWKICGWTQGDWRAPAPLRRTPSEGQEAEWEPTKREICHMGPDEEDWWRLKFCGEEWYPGKALTAGRGDMNFPAILDLYTYKSGQDCRRNQLIRFVGVSDKVAEAIRYPGRAERNLETGEWQSTAKGWGKGAAGTGGAGWS